jgi:putative MATE family efflux protein
MKDLTQGPISRLLVAMAVPIAIGMLFQTLYFLVDLYFVSRLGDAAIAGVSTAGTVSFVILALTQMLGVGTVALVSHAAGRKDKAEANLVFNQSVLLSAACGVLTLLWGLLAGGAYVRWVAADAAAAAAGTAYLYWYPPGLTLQFALVAMGSALRGTGIVQPTMLVQMLTVILNTVLAPILISGWGTHHPFGTAGAGLASSIAVAFGVVFLWVYFVRLEHYVALNPREWTPRWRLIGRILNIGLPAGGEFLMIFVILGVIYLVIRSFGPSAQAGFGIGGRVMQALPAGDGRGIRRDARRGRISVPAASIAWARRSAPRRSRAVCSCSSSRSSASGTRNGSSRSSPAHRMWWRSARLTCASSPGTSSPQA